MTDPDTIELINRAVEVAVQRAQQSLVQPQFLVGTIIELDTLGPGIHGVLLDGDVEEVAAMDVTDIAWFPIDPTDPTPPPPTERDVPGARAAIVFVPPHQLWIIGIIHREV